MSVQALVVFIVAVLAACVAVTLVGRWWVGVSARRQVEGSKRQTPPAGKAGPAQRSLESSYIVTLSDAGVSCTHPDKSVERLAWEDLESVEIVTTDAGPFATDVFWVLNGSSAGCVIPQGATGERQLLERLQELPGFDHQAVTRAMAESGNNRIVCWRRRR